MDFQVMQAKARKVAESGLEVGRETASKARQTANAAFNKTDGAHRAGIAGTFAGSGWALSFTHLGGFGVVAGGTGIGVAGLTGAAVATGGVALAGFSAGYLGYKAGQWIIESRFGGDGSRQGNGTSGPNGSPSGGGPSGPGLAGAPVGAFPRRPLGDVGAVAESRRFVREYASAVSTSSSGFPLSREWRVKCQARL